MGITDIVEGDFDAIIFDMDGTLVDTMPIHFQAWTAELAVHGLTMSEEEFYARGGTPAVDIARMIITRAGRELDPSMVAISKEERYLELLDVIPVIPSTLAVVQAWHGRVPLAVATGAKGYIADRVLAATGLRKYFNVVIAQEQYVLGKPAPDPYLRAAEALGVRPERCIVFEDTETGIQGAEAAGMHWILVNAPSRPVV